MQIGKKLFIVKTLSGETIAIRNSVQYARNDVTKAEQKGFECVVIECTIDALHVK